MKHQFNSGPSIEIVFDWIDGERFTSRLFLSEQFTVTNPSNRLLEWCENYAQKKHTNATIQEGEGFQKAILEALQKIPFGKTISYQKLGEMAGFTKHARAVGRAVHYNPCPLLIPCHRVIQSNGALGGFALDLEIKRRLLDFEAGRPAP